MPTCGLGTWSGPLPGDPGDISGLAAVPVFGGVQVSWNLPAVNPHALAYVTIFRGTSAAFGSAIQIATAGGDSYLDRVNSGTTYYYWAGSVSINGTQGALLGPVFAVAKPLIQDLLEELSGEIDRSSLGVDLKGELDRITLTEQALTAEVNARLAANAAYQSLLVDLDAGVTGGLAAVNQEILLRESEDSALAGEISSFASILVDPVTGLMATRATLAVDYYTKVGVDDAIATSTLTMVSQANLNATVDAAVDDAMVGVLNDYPTTAMLTAGYFTKAETNSAISGAIADYDASGGGNAAAINSAILTRVGYSALASNSTTPYDGDGTTIIYPVVTYPTIDYPEYALNRYRVIDDLGVDLWNATGPGIAKPLVWVPGLPMASAITQFGVTDAAGNSATLSQAFLTQKTLNDGFKGQYTVKLDVNGRVSGFGIYSDAVGSAAVFNVDKFAIGNVGAGTIYPFMVDTGVVYMNESVIQKLTFGKLTDAGGLFVVADGKIKTDYIETKGLTIKDLAGNVIFSSGQNLDFDRIGGSNKPANGATVGAPAGTLVNGVPVATITTAVSNFNSANDRNTTAVVVPGIPTGGAAIDHVLQDNGSADISFEWTWAGTEGDIDGFIVYVRQSTSASAYTLGTTPGEETAYVVPANKRAFVLYGALPNAYYTFGVRAYRKTDASVAGGLVQSTISQSGVAGENPYRPSTSIAFNGAISGTIDGVPSTTVVGNASDGAIALDKFSGVGSTLPAGNVEFNFALGTTKGGNAVNTDAVGTQSAATVQASTINFNNRNDRLATAVVTPTVAAATGTVDHTINADSSADVSFEWGWAGTATDIDGFIVYVHNNGTTTPASKYTFTGGSEPAVSVFYITPSQRAFIMYGVSANHWFTFGVQAYRIVDTDVDATGVKKSTIVQAAVSGETATFGAYRPTSSVAFTGDVTGTVANLAAATLVANANAGASAAATATAAQEDADAALLLLTDIASDSKLTPTEKQAIRKEWDEVYAERAGIVAQSAALGVASTTYTNRMNTLGTYLNGGTGYTASATRPLWINDSGSGISATTTIVGDTFRSNWSLFYSDRQALLNSISNTAATKADWSGVSGTGKPANSAGYVIDGYRDTNPQPKDFPPEETFYFKTPTAVGISSGFGAYGILRTVRPYGPAGSTDLSGGTVNQWFEINGLVGFRKSTSATTWGAWEMVPNGTINSANISNYFANAAIGWAQIGDLVISSAGGIRSGKTIYGDAGGTGWLLEYNGGTPRFDIGSSAAYMRWTGSALDVKNAVITGSTISSTTIAGVRDPISMAAFDVNGGGVPATATASLTRAGAGWYNNGSATVGDGYWVRVSKKSGTTPTGSSLDVWLQLNSTRSWTLTAASGFVHSCELGVEISTNSTGTIIVATGQINIEAASYAGAIP